MSVSRKDPDLNVAIAYLDDVYRRAGNSVQAAYAMLDASELAFIETETEQCLDLRYYLENYHCIRDEHGNWKTFYPWFQYQEILYEATQEEWEENGYCKIIVLKPRQSGISTWTAASMFHRTIFNPHMYTMLVGQNAELAEHIYSMSMNAYDALPWWMRPEYMFKTKGDEIVFQREDENLRTVNPGLGSILKCSNAQKMSGIAIGRSLQSFHGSEVSRWPDDGMFEADIKPSMNARDTYSILESTGFGRQGFFYEHWRGSLAGDTGYRAVFIPVYRSKKYYLPFSKKNPVKNEALRAEFILRAEEEKFNARVIKEEEFEIPKEFWNFHRSGLRAAKTSSSKAGFIESYPLTPTQAFQGSGICAFDAETIEEQELKFICKPLWVGEIFLAADGVSPNIDAIREVGDDEILVKRKGSRPTDRLHIWMWPKKGETYYISGDVALGVAEGDYSVATVYLAGLGSNSDEQVASWWGHCPPEHFAKILAALGYWYNGAEIACEYEKEGITTGNKLVEMDYPALYRERLKDRPGAPFKVYFHFSMTQKTRSSIIATMNEALLTHNQRGDPGVVWRDEDLLDEAIDFASISGSKMEGQGNHDDGIVSAMIGLHCLRETTTHLKAAPDSSNLGHSDGDINVYGIFDNLSRQRGQYNSKEVAYELLKSQPDSWTVRPILICAANTLTSPIDTPGTAEHELRYKHGLARRGILPDVVHAYRDAVGFNGYGRRDQSVATADPDWD